MTTALAVTLLTLTPHFPQETQEPVRAERAAIQSGAEDRALTALAAAREALADWRRELEQGGTIEPASARRLMSAAQALGRDMQAMLQRADAQEAVPSGGERPRGGERAPQVSPRDLSEPWIEDVRAIGEGAAARRADALTAMRAALRGTDSRRQWAALIALSRVGEVAYDKAAFRPLVLPLLESSSGAMLVSGLYALHNVERRPEDLALVYQAWERRTPELDGSISHLLMLYGEGTIEGRSEEILLELLASPEASTRQTLPGIWGARVTDRLAARVVALADDPESRHDAIYFGLSTFADKNEQVIDTLIATLTDPDHNNSGRALWGLGHGVPARYHAKVAAVLVDLHNSRSSPKIRRDCKRLVERYGSAEVIGRLER